jgi:putative selenate reductase
MVEVQDTLNGGIPFQSRHQVIHIDQQCNECGNCADFCPWEGKPYKDKFTIFFCEEDFKDSENPGCLKIGGKYKIRLKNKSTVDYHKGEANIPDEWITLIETIEAQYGYVF